MGKVQDIKSKLTGAQEVRPTPTPAEIIDGGIASFLAAEGAVSKEAMEKRIEILFTGVKLGMKYAQAAFVRAEDMHHNKLKSIVREDIAATEAKFDAARERLEHQSGPSMEELIKQYAPDVTPANPPPPVKMTDEAGQSLDDITRKIEALPQGIKPPQRKADG